MTDRGVKTLESVQFNLNTNKRQSPKEAASQKAEEQTMSSTDLSPTGSRTFCLLASQKHCTSPIPLTLLTLVLMAFWSKADDCENGLQRAVDGPADTDVDAMLKISTAHNNVFL